LGPDHDEIEAEQSYIDAAYQRLEELRGDATKRTSGVLAQEWGGVLQAKVQREAFVKADSRRWASLNVGDQPLVFGRIDRSDQSIFYIGRAAIYDRFQDPMVLDWKAPVSEAFYRATPSDPMDVVRRRHFICRGKRLLRLDDELMDAEKPPNGLVLMGEAALLDAMQRHRTGRMRDVVATVQAEQDGVIRAPLDGIHVVQGGPGTGKTVVALHRAAYLSYTHRRRLAGSGVLVVGPNSVFLRYIEDVLPSLGEDHVKLSTPGALVDGVVATRHEERMVARAKGEVAMVGAISRAIADHETRIAAPISIWHDSVLVTLTPDASWRAIAATRAAGLPHNRGRGLLERAVVDALFADFQKALEDERRSDLRGEAIIDTKDGGQNRAAFNEGVADHPKSRDAIEQMWPIIDTNSFLEELLSANGLGQIGEQADPGLSDADVVLIDEIRTQLGPPPMSVLHEETLANNESKEEAVRQVLDDILGYMALDEFMLADVARMVEQNYDAEFDRPDKSPNQRHEFGHVLVDEAQELSPMQWRMISRRCPSGSMTIVGDLGQASAPWAPATWSEVVDLLPKGANATVMELSINYRTPVEVMEFASRLLKDSGLELRQPRSVRTTGCRPIVRDTSIDGMPVALKDLCIEARAVVGEGNVAVLTSSEFASRALSWLADELADEHSDDQLAARIAVFEVDKAKGLEFDAVIVVEPASIIEQWGPRTLYMAFTRPTRQLYVLHSQPLPKELGIGSAEASRSVSQG